VSDIVQMVIAARTICGHDPKVATEESWAAYDRVMARHEAEEAVLRVKRERIDRHNYYRLLASIAVVVGLWLISITALMRALL